MTLPAMLIVEDEPLIRMCAADFAEEAGYRVREADTAAEALNILESGEDVEILFTDITLPGGMDGLALADLVAERWPSVRIMLASGALAGMPADIAPSAFRLPKPYGITEFLSAVKQIKMVPGEAG